MFCSQLQCGLGTQAEDKKNSQKGLRGSKNKVLSSSRCIIKIFDCEIEDIGRQLTLCSRAEEIEIF